MTVRKTERTAGRNKNRKHGDLPRAVAEASGRALSTVYAVLRGKVTSGPVQEAIDRFHLDAGNLPVAKPGRKGAKAQ